MTRGLRIVAPFRPFQPESVWHQHTHAFDWIDAIRMMRDSAIRVCRCPVHVLTDVDTVLPVETLQYVTTERRLMLWTLEVCLRYLDSDDFDRDTVMLDCDQLVFHDLSRWFTPRVDLGLLVRSEPKYAVEFPLLNGVQFWARRGKDKLVAFFQRALDLARTLPEPLLVWGADTEAIQRLIAPIEVGIHRRAGLRVRLIESSDVLETFSSHQIQALHDGALPRPVRAVCDFRALRKRYMRPVYEATRLCAL